MNERAEMVIAMEQRLWVYAGEMTSLLRRFGLQPAARSPLLQIPDVLDDEPERTPDEVAAAALEVLGEDQFAAHLAAIAEPYAVVRVQRGVRRTSPNTFFACTADPEWRIVTLLSPNVDGSATLLLPWDREKLLEWLLQAFGYLAQPEIPFLELPPVSPSGLGVLLALADLFRDRYPDPDPEWAPDEPIRSSLEELERLLEAGRTGADPHSLIQGYAGLVGEPLPTLAGDDLEAFLYVLADKQLIEFDEEATDGVAFELGERLTWALRCLAWWDVSLAVEAWPPGEHPHVERVVALQASAVWRFARVGEGAGALVQLSAVGGDALETDLDTLLDQVAAPPETEMESEAPEFGTEAPAVCPSCGLPRRPSARFCGSCGQPFEDEMTDSGGRHG